MVIPLGRWAWLGTAWTVFDGRAIPALKIADSAVVYSNTDDPGSMKAFD